MSVKKIELLPFLPCKLDVCPPLEMWIRQASLWCGITYLLGVGPRRLCQQSVWWRWSWGWCENVTLKWWQSVTGLDHSSLSESESSPAPASLCPASPQAARLGWGVNCLSSMWDLPSHCYPHVSCRFCFVIYGSRSGYLGVASHC